MENKKKLQQTKLFKQQTIQRIQRNNLFKAQTFQRRQNDKYYGEKQTDKNQTAISKNLQNRKFRISKH
jgi:hypothetical protein